MWRFRENIFPKFSLQSSFWVISNFYLLFLPWTKISFFSSTTRSDTTNWGICRIFRKSRFTQNWAGPKTPTRTFYQFELISSPTTCCSSWKSKSWRREIKGLSIFTRVWSATITIEIISYTIKSGCLFWMRWEFTLRISRASLYSTLSLLIIFIRWIMSWYWKNWFPSSRIKKFISSKICTRISLKGNKRISWLFIESKMPFFPETTRILKLGENRTLRSDTNFSPVFRPF